MTVTVADRTLDQRLAALEKANQVRTMRARLKRDIYAGRVSAAEVIGNPPAFVLTMPVVQVLDAQHYWTDRRARWFLLRLRVSDNRTVGGLTPRQARLVVAALEDHHNAKRETHR